MLQDGSYQPGRAYHTTHEDRFNFAAARAAWGIEGRWGALQLASRQETLSDLFLDLGESVYENRDFQQGDVLLAFMNHGPLPSQELHEALKEAHETIGLEADERVRLREEVPAIDANAQTVVLLTDQLVAMSNQHQEAQAAAAFNAERDAGQLRGQIGLVQQDLAQARNDLIAALAQATTQVAERSVEGERSGGAQGCGPLQPAGYEPHTAKKLVRLGLKTAAVLRLL